MNKIRQYFSTITVIRGLFTAMVGSAFIYLNYFGFSLAFIHTILGLLFFYFLLNSDTKVWFVTGAFLGLFWFWWIALSLIHYHMTWAAPIEIVIIMLIYGTVFFMIAWCATFIASYSSSYATLVELTLKASALLLLSYVHPFSFDWFKPELIFVESYLGIQKFQFAIILSAMVLSLWRKHLGYLFLVLFAYPFTTVNTSQPTSNITLVTTHTSVEEKWDENLHAQQFQHLFNAIDAAIAAHKSLIVLPESVFPIFLNRSAVLLDKLQAKSKHISIVTGGLYWDGTTPRNSTYIFTHATIQVANKVLLVPFGESNPLPDFLSDWVNEVFYDGAVDYKASSKISDYRIDGVIYRNAICFEATSEKLYEGSPKHMIVLSNNGWFYPSTESTLQKLLLQYYSHKYGTTIYHAVNMSESYIVHNGIVRKE